MMNWIKGIVVNRPSSNVIGVGRGEAFYSSIISSQFFSELLPVDCELHKCFSVFFFFFFC